MEQVLQNVSCYVISLSLSFLIWIMGMEMKCHGY